jgi:cytochrome P450
MPQILPKTLSLHSIGRSSIHYYSIVGLHSQTHFIFWSHSHLCFWGFSALLISLGFRIRDRATEEVRQVVDTLVQDASLSLASQIKKTNESDSSDQVEGGTAAENLLDHLLTSGCSKELVRHECLNILLAARDTTASLLSSCIYELARDSPRKTAMWRKLKDEVERLGSGIDVTLDQVRELKYLRAVLNESLRSVAPISFTSVILLAHDQSLCAFFPSDSIHPCGQTLDMRLKTMCYLLAFSFPPGV